MCLSEATGTMTCVLNAEQMESGHQSNVPDEGAEADIQHDDMEGYT